MNLRNLFVLGAAATLVVSACAASATPSPSAAPTAPPSAAPSEAASATPAAVPDAELAAALAGEYKGKSVEIMGQWVQAEGDSFQASLKDFIAKTGINIVYGNPSNYETVLAVRVDGGNAPDLAQIAQPGGMRQYQADGKLIDVSTFIDVDRINADYNPSFVDLASVDGKMYGVYYKGDLKSIVWYPVQQFKEKGYEVPTTWDELVALSDKIVADGSNPWCTTIEHGDASGWVATDWIEDVLLRTAPLETYDKWVSHEIPFNDPAVLNAAKLVGQMWFTKDYVYGGNTRINATWVGDSQTPMFDKAGPKCWMHKQAAWIPAFWPKDAAGTALYPASPDTYAFFYFPPIDPQYGKPVLGGGDMFMMFADRPEVRAVIEYLSTPDAAKAWIANGGFVSPNNAVPAEWYTKYPDSGLAEILRNATALRFDGSDTMPKVVGAGTFWKGMVDWVSKNGADTEQIFQTIEDSWPK